MVIPAGIAVQSPPHTVLITALLGEICIVGQMLLNRTRRENSKTEQFGAQTRFIPSPVLVHLIAIISKFMVSPFLVNFLSNFNLTILSIQHGKMFVKFF